MPPLSDTHGSRVVLIGVADHINLPALPSVSNNLTALAETFTDPARWGLEAENCEIVREPKSPQDVQVALHRSATAVRSDGLLLVYFAGHGIADTNSGELHLAVANSATEAAYATAVPYDWVRRIVRESPASRRVVILDCCYAGRAIAGMGQADPGGIAAETEIEESCVLVAASANRLTLAPRGETYTAFTGVLLDVLRRGVTGGPNPLDLITIYEQIAQVQRRKGRPIPELLARNGGDRIPLVINAAAHAGYLGEVFTVSPRHADPYLAGAPIGLLAHSPADGALGVRLDRTTARSPADLLGEERAHALGLPSVFEGGPVGDVVLLLVTLRNIVIAPSRFRRITDALGTLPLTADVHGLDLVENACIFTGYLGWRPGQLESEMGDGLLTPAGFRMVDWLARHAQTR